MLLNRDPIHQNKILNGRNVVMNKTKAYPHLLMVNQKDSVFNIHTNFLLKDSYDDIQSQLFETF